MKRTRSNHGYTIVEMLIGLFLTGIISLAGLQFYARLHNQAITQEDIGDMQQSARNNLDEITRTLSKAGFRLPASHAPFEIADGTLRVFYSENSPVDTVSFFLADDYGVCRQGGDDDGESTLPSKMLMKQTNSGSAEVYGRQIENITYTVVSPSVIDVAITVGVDRPDEDYVDNDGVRRFTLSNRVQLRNLKL